MSRTDLPVCRHLVQQAGWNQSEADWLRTMKLEPNGCFMAEKEGIPVATATTCCFEKCAWIAMVLVDTAFRNRGIAKQMLLHAMDYLERKGVTTIRLDATVLGQGLYKKLGFEEEYEVTRFVREPESGKATSSYFQKPIDEEVMRDIMKLDRHATGVDRAMLLHSVVGQGSPFFYLNNGKKMVEGYAFTREGASAIQIGPAIAANADAGRHILDQMASQLQGRRIFVDIPSQNVPAVHWAEANDFVKQRTFVRMCRGERIQDIVEFIWASSGPEKG
ncbi:MAG: GNAT family N-acetyltransferase [Dyadobacter sp.]|uniref:GNAT family N-acetyltransferase n=1 Tax=Dyadobacter sp. TaxID=1914288 RepID=UPI0032647231